MSLEGEIAALKRQNRRLKTAMFAMVGIVILAVVTVSGFTALAAARARAEERRAVEMAKQVRDHAQAALAAQARFEQDKAQPGGEPGPVR